VVLGPALDGGYYLVGLRKPSPELFTGIPWSTDRVLALTQQKAAALGLHQALLPVRRDIDTINDLMAVIEETGMGHEARGISEVRHSKFDVGGQKEPNLEPGMLSPRTAGVLRLLANRLRAHTQRTSKTVKAAALL